MQSASCTGLPLWSCCSVCGLDHSVK